MWIKAQDSDLLLGDETFHFLDRLDVKGHAKVALPSDLKPYSRTFVVHYLRNLDTSTLSRRDKAQWSRTCFLVDDSFPPVKQPILKAFYKNRRDFWMYSDKNVRLYVNPGLNLNYGFQTFDPKPVTESEALFRNARAGIIRASLWNKVGIYTEVQEQQARFPNYIFDNNINEAGVIPGEGVWKPFKNTAYDFPAARAYITYEPVEQFRIKFGRDRVFIGNGYQSMFIGDNATEINLLQLTTRFNKFEYVNLFTQMLDFVPNKPDGVGTYPRKYGTFHLLTFRPVKQLAFSVFEGLVYANSNLNGSRGFDIQYLNPVIFYRTAETLLGSPDNAVLGVSFKANVFKQVQTYGQFNLDDFNLSESRQGSDYWGNKYGWQLGTKYIDVLGISTFDLQFEYNRVRPYTFSHFNPSINYSHFGTPLAHSLGANFQELVIIARYQPIPKLYLYGQITRIQQGYDGLLPNGNHSNVGTNIFRSYIVRDNLNGGRQDFNVQVGQGVNANRSIVHGRIAYQLLNLNAFIEAEIMFRKTANVTTTIALAGLRYNLPYRSFRL